MATDLTAELHQGFDAEPAAQAPFLATSPAWLAWMLGRYLANRQADRPCKVTASPGDKIRVDNEIWMPATKRRDCWRPQPDGNRRRKALGMFAMVVMITCHGAWAQNEGRYAQAPLPETAVGDDGPAIAYIGDAREALRLGRTDEAREAMERAITRISDRSVPLFQTNDPSDNPAVDALNWARSDLKAGRYDRVRGDLDRAADFMRWAHRWRAREVYQTGPYRAD